MINVNTLQSFDEIISLKAEYMKSLAGPQEAWLEETAQNNALHEICFDKQRAGYFCSDTSCNLLLQLYILGDYIRKSQELFPFLISNDFIKTAYVTTRDSLALSLCLDFQQQVSIESYLFRDNEKVKIELRGFEHICFREAIQSDVENINDICERFFGALYQRYGLTIGKSTRENKLFVLYSGAMLLAVGCVETQYCSAGSANLGMFVNEDFRRRQVGSYIITKLKEYCYSNGLEPIAACYHENQASRRTLEKAGLVARDRTLLVRLKE